MKLIFSIAILAFIWSAVSRAETCPDGRKIPKFKTIPHLSPDLPNGTLAWEFPNNLHAGQIGTGGIEDQRKLDEYEDHAPSNPEKFPKDLYKFLYCQKVISPVILGPVPPWDSRRYHYHRKWLAWVTDRTHGSAAESMEIAHRLGPDALTRQTLDDKERPLGFILVEKISDWSNMPIDRFERRMVSGGHVYLFNFIHTVNDKTQIVPIRFRDLPETPYDTVDNPFRSVIGEAQHRDWIPRVSTDFFQFKLAAQLVLDNVISWNEILEGPEKAEWKASKYFKQHPTYLTGESAKYCRLLLEGQR